MPNNEPRNAQILHYWRRNFLGPTPSLKWAFKLAIFTCLACTLTYPFSLFCMDINGSPQAIGMHHHFLYFGNPRSTPSLSYASSHQRRAPMLPVAKCNPLHILWCFCKDAHQHTIACTLHWGLFHGWISAMKTWFTVIEIFCIFHDL